MKFKKSASVYNECFPEYILSDDQVERLHRVLLVIMDDIDALCRRHGIPYMLSGGSCLGAVRHKGFIPWDDDMDVMMYWEDMIRLHECISREFPKKYLSCLPYEGKGALRFMKIYLKGTEYVEIGTEGLPTPKHIFIDVFPVVTLPDSEKTRHKYDRKHYIASRFFSVGFDSKYPSPLIKQKAKKNAELKKYYNMRLRLGRLGRLFGLNFWKRRCLKLERGANRTTETEGIPCAISYAREVFERGFFAELIEADFEGRRYYIPKEYHRYLKNLYGDYMQIPPPEKRERHMASAVDFGQYQ